MRSHFVIAFLCRETVPIETLGKAFKESLDGLRQALVPNTTAFSRHAKVVENRMSRLVFRNAVERDMFEGDRLFTGSDEEYADLLPIGVCKDLTETPLGFDGMSDSIPFFKRHTLVLVKANAGHQARLEVGARDERTLEAVAWMPLIMIEASPLSIPPWYAGLGKKATC